jgi:hypothetical protein
MTAPSTRDGNSSHLDVTPREFERRLAAHGHSSDEIHLLWNELAVAEPVASETGRKLGLGSVIAVYLGLLLVVTASVSLLAIYWNDLDSRGVLSLALSYLAAYLVTGEILRRRELAQPADVLEAVAVGWVGLATYAVLDLVGAWPEGASDLDYIHSGLTTIAVVGLAAALLLLVVRPDPLLLVPIAIATGLLAVDLGEIVSGSGIDDLSERQIAACILPLGLAWIATGLWLDVQQRRRYATWAHWVGLVGSAFAIIMIVPKTVPGFALVGALGAVALFFSALVRHWSFTVIGALGVLMAVISAMGMLGGIAPLVIAIVGLALILVGLRWSRWRESIRTTALARMPDSARDLVTRLAPPS